MHSSIEDAIQTYPISKVESDNNCGRINKSLQLAIIQDTNMDAQFVKGTIKFEDRSSPHYYVKVNINQDEYIIDGAIDQFIGDFIPEDTLQNINTVNDKIIFENRECIPFTYTNLKE